MEAQHIKGCTRVLAENQDEYFDLPIRDEDLGYGNQMTSQWKPSKEELECLLNGGCIELSILGHTHPPVILSTTPLQPVLQGRVNGG